MPQTAPLRTALLTVLLALPACEDYLFDQVCPEAISEVARTVPALEPTPADILFVVDNSGSMREEQENLAANFASFIDALSGGGGDFRLAIITTDGAGFGQCAEGVEPSDSECGGFVSFEFASEYPFQRTGTDDSMCVETGTPLSCFVTDDGGRAVISSDQTPEEIEQSFRQAVRVGTCGDGVEVGLETMRRALERTQGGCNGGFLRDEANLVVVFVSDEPGRSLDDDDRADGIQDEELEPFVRALADAKGGDLSKVRAAAIVGAVDGRASDCRTEASPAPDDPATGVCGSLCDDVPESFGSEIDCNPSDLDPCPSGETCSEVGTGTNRRFRCIEAIWVNHLFELDLGNPRGCASCSNYLTDDCCTAQPGDEYIAFVERIGSLASGRDDVSCQPEEGRRTFCLLDSICQENFSETLERIARELVGSAEFALDPPADNPSGVKVDIVRGDTVVRELANGEDFEVSEGGERLQILRNGPGEGEGVDVFYTTERTISRPPRGACGTSSTSTTAS